MRLIAIRARTIKLTGNAARATARIVSTVTAAPVVNPNMVRALTAIHLGGSRTGAPPNVTTALSSIAPVNAPPGIFNSRPTMAPAKALPNATSVPLERPRRPTKRDTLSSTLSPYAFGLANAPSIGGKEALSNETVVLSAGSRFFREGLRGDLDQFDTTIHAQAPRVHHDVIQSGVVHIHMVELAQVLPRRLVMLLQ